MAHLLRAQQQPAPIEVADDFGVGVLGERARARQPRRHLAALVHGADEEQALAPAVREVLAAEGRGDVDDARAVVEGDVAGGDDAAQALRLVSFQDGPQTAIILKARNFVGG